MPERTRDQFGSSEPDDERRIADLWLAIEDFTERAVAGQAAKHWLAATERDMLANSLQGTTDGFFRRDPLRSWFESGVLKEGPLGAYVFGVAEKRVNEVLRERSRRFIPREGEEAPDVPEDNDYIGDREKGIDEERGLAALEEYLAGLPSRQRRDRVLLDYALAERDGRTLRELGEEAPDGPWSANTMYRRWERAFTRVPVEWLERFNGVVRQPLVKATKG